MAPQKVTVLVTGFQPFGEYKINSSWIAVEELASQGLGPDINLIVKEVPVEYDAIDKKVPHWWSKYDPLLVVHVGLSGIARTFTLEQLAHNSNYDKYDNNKKLPKNHCCKPCGVPAIQSTIDMQKVSQIAKGHGVNAVISKDAGMYLCEYIYYMSLHMKRNHAAFIHVPPLNRPHSKQELGHGLKEILLAMLKVISERDNNCECSNKNISS